MKTIEQQESQAGQLTACETEQPSSGSDQVEVRSSQQPGLARPEQEQPAQRQRVRVAGRSWLLQPGRVRATKTEEAKLVSCCGCWSWLLLAAGPGCWPWLHPCPCLLASLPPCSLFLPPAPAFCSCSCLHVPCPGPRPKCQEI